MWIPEFELRFSVLMSLGGKFFYPPSPLMALQFSWLFTAESLVDRWALPCGESNLATLSRLGKFSVIQLQSSLWEEPMDVSVSGVLSLLWQYVVLPAKCPWASSLGKQLFTTSSKGWVRIRPGSEQILPYRQSCSRATEVEHEHKQETTGNNERLEAQGKDQGLAGEVASAGRKGPGTKDPYQETPILL